MKDEHGEPWFVAAGVCKALLIKNTSDALSRLDADEKGIALVDTLGGRQEMFTVNESGLYSMIIGSGKQETVGQTLRIVGWHRDRDALVIYLSRHDSFTVPASAMQYRVVERANVGTPLSACPLPPCEGRRTSPAS